MPPSGSGPARNGAQRVAIAATLTVSSVLAALQLLALNRDNLRNGQYVPLIAECLAVVGFLAALFVWLLLSTRIRELGVRRSRDVERVLHAGKVSKELYPILQAIDEARDVPGSQYIPHIPAMMSVGISKTGISFWEGVVKPTMFLEIGWAELGEVTVVSGQQGNALWRGLSFRVGRQSFRVSILGRRFRGLAYASEATLEGLATELNGRRMLIHGDTA